MALGAVVSPLRQRNLPVSHHLPHSADSSTCLSGYFRVALRPTSTRDFQTSCLQGGSTQNVLARKWQKNPSKANGVIEETLQVSTLDQTQQRIETVRKILQAIGDGELSISAYDTAWVALVKDMNGKNAPQFPSTLEWIVNNQLPDGSWGDRHFFSAYDRLSCTLACVVALKTWDEYPEGRERGLSFIRQNLHRLRDEDPEHLLSGFEVTFTSMIKLAEKLGLDVLQDPSVLQDLYAKREQKLKRIPMETLHSVPTTLLHSLEGLPNLDWDRLMKLQHPNGSFLCSPSSTASALVHTKDWKCFQYLKEIVDRFNGGVPHTYPVDIFERLWVVDRMDRLGVSRYFKSEIKDCLDYVHRFWTPNGLSWSRNTVELDIDDTSMGFRILRLHGYNVKADAFNHFEREGQFYCFVGQMNQGLTEMLSLYRASQVLFPAENILDKASDFAFRFLKMKQDLGQVADRWLVTKDLPGEVNYYLSIPWYASLPRVETRFYIDQYGGDNDVWIAKSLYRMYNVSNNHYLELAKSDYNNCQKLHQREWIDIQRWYQECSLGEFGLSKEDMLKLYFLAMSSTFEPERAVERLAWAQTTAMIEAVSCHFSSISLEEKKFFAQDFTDGINKRGNCYSESGNKLVHNIVKTLRKMSLKLGKLHGNEVYENLHHAWNTWLHNLVTKEDRDEAELLVLTINMCSGHFFSKTLMSQSEYTQLTNKTNTICNSLRQKQGNFTADNIPTRRFEQEMQELVQQVLQSNEGSTDQEIKTTFLAVAKTYYYTAYCDPSTVDFHINKVLFENVV